MFGWNGTTLSVVLLTHDKINVGHVGDSRVYLLREGNLFQISQDHSLVADMVRNGQLEEEDAKSHPQKYFDSSYWHYRIHKSSM